MATPKTKKTTAKPKPKPKKNTAKPKPKQSAPKSQPKTKTTKKPAAAKKNGNGNGGSRLSNPRWDKIAKLSTTLVQTGDGRTLNRAAITTPKVELVMSTLVGRKSASAVLKSLGFKTTKQAADYAGGKITRGDLPVETNRAVTEAAAKCGDPRVHKMNGRALVSVIVAATK